jgi:HEAT repeat protein
MRRYLFLILLSLLPPCLNAQVGVPAGDVLVRPVFEKADFVCICRLETVTAERLDKDQGISRQRNLFTVVAKIVDVYKSQSSLRETPITFEYPSRSQESGIRANQFVLLFLKSRPDLTYDLADPMIGLTMFSRISTGWGPTGFDRLRSALVSYIRTEHKQDQINAMLLLKGIPGLDADGLSAVNALSSSTDSELAFRSLAILLETGSSGSVSKLRRYLDEDKDTQPSSALDSAAEALSQITDVVALPDIEALTRSRFISIQFAAMNAIRRIASPKSAPTLVQRLDDPNPNVQYSAVITLAELFGADGDYGPDMQAFDKNPKKYIALWKQRWAEQSSAPPQ